MQPRYDNAPSILKCRQSPPDATSLDSSAAHTSYNKIPCALPLASEAFGITSTPLEVYDLYKNYEHRRAERIARPKVYFFEQRRKPVRVFSISTDERRANGSATSLVCFVRGFAALPLSETFSQHCLRKLHAFSDFFVLRCGTWVARVAKTPRCNTASLPMREECPQHRHNWAGELGHS